MIRENELKVNILRTPWALCVDGPSLSSEMVSLKECLVINVLTDTRWNNIVSLCHDVVCCVNIQWHMALFVSLQSMS